MRVRSHKYPDDDFFIDTVRYDSDANYLDLGYQRLKNLQPKSYPEFSVLKKLFIDHNSLTILPEPEFVPNLIELTCSVNCLKKIPFYPNLTFLKIAHNSVTDLSLYANSKLKFLDVSHNVNFKLNFVLPDCKHLYINDNEIAELDLKFTPKLQFLDCSSNKLVGITGGNLVEINCSLNPIIDLPLWENLLRINADSCQLTVFKTYPKLISANLSFNLLNQINDQPSLTKLVANDNSITNIGSMPKLEMLDLRLNRLNKLVLPSTIEYVSVHFNPINDLDLSDETLKMIKELQINYDTYSNIYSKYYQFFDSVNVQTNEEQLEILLQKLSSVFSEKIIRTIFRKFCEIKFRDRENELFKITLEIYWNFFSKKNGTLEELVDTIEFKTLYKNITKIYYKTIVITLYFNGYYN